jgi:hypothetical protein
VDEIRDEIAEQMELAQEISEAISMPLATQDAWDEDELDAELELLQTEEIESIRMRMFFILALTAKGISIIEPLGLYCGRHSYLGPE